MKMKSLIVIGISAVLLSLLIFISFLEENPKTQAQEKTEEKTREINFSTPKDNVSQMRNGIEQNPGAVMEFNTAEKTAHSFVESTWEILGRFATQEEWERWHERLVQAKAEGQAQLLSEAIALEQELFNSAEYIARRRTDEEFVEDVFESHLFRGISKRESKYWQEHLQNIKSSEKLTEKESRQLFLNDFEDLPDFVAVVNNLVDEVAPPEPIIILTP